MFHEVTTPALAARIARMQQDNAAERTPWHTLEKPFRDELNEIARRQKRSVRDLCEEVAGDVAPSHRVSALREYVVRDLIARIDAEHWDHLRTAIDRDEAYDRGKEDGARPFIEANRRRSEPPASSGRPPHKLTITSGLC